MEGAEWMRSRQINYLTLPTQEMVFLAICLMAHCKTVAGVVGYLPALFSIFSCFTFLFSFILVALD